MAVAESWSAECQLHHPWRPGTVTITWEPCDCPPAQAARGGHIKVSCNAPRCGETWWSPLHRPRPGPQVPAGLGSGTAWQLADYLDQHGQARPSRTDRATGILGGRGNLRRSSRPGQPRVRLPQTAACTATRAACTNRQAPTAIPQRRHTSLRCCTTCTPASSARPTGPSPTPASTTRPGHHAAGPRPRRQRRPRPPERRGHAPERAARGGGRWPGQLPGQPRRRQRQPATTSAGTGRRRSRRPGDGPPRAAPHVPGQPVGDRPAPGHDPASVTWRAGAGSIVFVVGEYGHRVVIEDVSHQLRTQLAALGLRLDLLAQESGQDAADFAGALGDVARLSRLVDGLLAVARARTPRRWWCPCWPTGSSASASRHGPRSLLNRESSSPHPRCCPRAP